MDDQSSEAEELWSEETLGMELGEGRHPSIKRDETRKVSSLTNRKEKRHSSKGSELKYST